MSKETLTHRLVLTWILVLSWPVLANAQVPVGEDGEPLEATLAGDSEIPLLSAGELETLVGPIALYPDDLLAIVLPASTYPLQLIQAERFLQDLKVDSELEPDEAWDDSIVALLNYPEAIQLLTKDLDKTWRLGEAVVAQQADVIAAIESFRDRAYAAGNLQSDSRQTVAENDGVIEITPVEEDVIYVPYYEPEQVVVYQPRPVYYYYPRAYPVYYYPYAHGYSFNYGFFWGVTTAFTVGWITDSLHVRHHSYYGHPYHGRYYGYNYWYRRPSIHVHNNYYFSNNNYVNNRHGYGDYWRPRTRSTVNYYDQRVTRNRHYAGNGSSRHGGPDYQERRSRSTQRLVAESGRQAQQVQFRQRTSTASNQASKLRPSTSRSERTRVTGKQREQIEFRERPRRTANQSSRDTQFASAKNQQARTSQSRDVTRPARAQRSDGSAQTQRFNRSERSSQPQRSSRPERSSQPQRSSRPERSSQPQRSSRPERASQPQRSSRPKSTGAAKPQRSAQAQRFSRPNKAAKPSRSSSPKAQSPKRSGSNKVARSESNNRNRGNNRRR